jgi:hypothetical protein
LRWWLVGGSAFLGENRGGDEGHGCRRWGRFLHLSVVLSNLPTDLLRCRPAAAGAAPPLALEPSTATHAAHPYAWPPRPRTGCNSPRMHLRPLQGERRRQQGRGGRGSGAGGTASRWRGDGGNVRPLPLFSAWTTPGVTRAPAPRETTPLCVSRGCPRGLFCTVPARLRRLCRTPRVRLRGWPCAAWPADQPGSLAATHCVCVVCLNEPGSVETVFVW